MPLEKALLARGWSTMDLAWTLGYSTDFTENMINNTAFKPDVALRLEAALGIKAEAWMDLCQEHDLGLLRRRMGSELAMIQRRAIRADELVANGDS
jgi:plasmid maintenance system antidote protein VapI